MDYLVDTVALVRHLRAARNLGSKARSILRQADTGQHRVFISGVTLMEIFYLSEKKRIPVDLESVRNLLIERDNYRVFPVDMDVVATAALIDDVPELHDRLIVATAKWLGVAILTNDPVISASKHVEVIW